MTKEIIDQRFKILEEIGKGGMGVVYRVADLLTDKLYALKTLPSIFRSESFLNRFKNEFKTIAHLNHPNLVEVYDFGIDENKVPYFTMEFIEGWSLDIFPYVQNLKYFLPLVIQVVDALDYIHSRGLVHRDIKPTNILIFKDALSHRYRVKLTDFGLATSPSGKPSEMPGGTVMYMAPEVLKNERIDFLSDLYSLGVVLYRVLTRSSPFMSSNSGVIMKQQISDRLIEPKEINPDIPEELNWLIVKLLRPEPEERCQSAVEVRELFLDLMTKIKEITTFPNRQKELYHSHFIGRNNEFHILKNQFEKMSQGGSGIVTVSGETGIGKSRLMKEIKHYIQLKHHLVFMTKIPDSEHITYSPISQLFDYITHFVAGRENDLLQNYLPFLERLIPMIHQKLNGATPAQLPIMDPLSEKTRLEDGLLRFIQDVSRKFPMTLIFEDIHNASNDDIHFIQAISSRLENVNSLLIVTYNPDHILHNTRTHVFVEELFKNPRSEQITLDRFNERETRDLVRSIVGDNIEDEQLYQILFNHTEGNPLYVDEYLQMLVNRGGLNWENASWIFNSRKAEKISVPNSINEMLQTKIETLNHEQMKLLQFFSCFGREFDLSLVCEMTDVDQKILDKLISQLVKNRTIEPLSSKKNGKFSFTHGAYQQLLYQKIQASTRKDNHLLIAQKMEQQYLHGQYMTAGDIAIHFLNAKNYEKGIEYAFIHASYLISTYAHEKAITSLHQIIEHLNASRQNELKRKYMLKAYSKLREIYTILGHWDNALNAIDKCKKSVFCKPDHIADFFYGADIYFRKGDYKTALRLVSLARKQLPEKEITPLSGRLTLLKSLILDNQGKNNKAISHCREAINIFNQLGDDNLLAKAYNALGKMYDTFGDPKKMIKWLSKSLKLRRKIGDKYGEAACLNNLALAFFELRMTDVAIKFCCDSIKLNKKIGYLECLAKNYCNLADIYLELGDSKKALENQSLGLDIYKSVSDQRGQAVALNNMGRAKQNLAEFSEAERYLQLSLDLRMKIGDVPLRVRGYCYLGNLLSNLHRFDEAIQCHKNALILARKSDTTHLPSLVYSLLANDYLLINDLQKSERYLKLSQKTDKKLQKIETRYYNERIQAQLLLRKGDLNKARKVINGYLENALNWNNKREEGIAYRLHAEYYALKGNLQKATTWFERSMECFQKIHNPYELALSYKLNAEYASRHDPEKGKTLFHHAQQLFKSMDITHEVDDIDRFISDIERRVLGKRRSHRNFQILIEASKAMMSIPDLDELLTFLVDKSLEISQAQRGFLVLLDEKYRLQTKVVKHFTQRELDGTNRFSSSIIQEVLRQRSPIFIPDAMTDDRFREQSSIVGFDIRSVISIPLISPRIHREVGKLSDESTTHLAQDILGVIYLDSQIKNHVFTEDDLNSVIALANDAAIALENMHLFRLATIDGLTRTYIYRYFQQRLKEELLRASRFRRNLSLLMIDIDHFKEYNDRYGHQAGNIVLRTIAFEIKSILRSTDVLCRFGGEEFALIIPETDCYGAYTVGEKIRQTIEILDINNTNITVSIGIACFPDHNIRGRGDFIEKSDFALYQAKMGGRNKTIIFSPQDLNSLSENCEPFVPHNI